MRSSWPRSAMRSLAWCAAMPDSSPCPPCPIMRGPISRGPASWRPPGQRRQAARPARWLPPAGRCPPSAGWYRSCRPRANRPPDPMGDVMKIDDWLLEILACPKCHAPLQPDAEASELVCTNAECGLAYPVRDDIPVLLVDEARDPQAG